MFLNNMNVGAKIGGGFGVVLVLLILAGALTFWGVSGIVDNAGDVIEGNKLDSNLAQKEVDHLLWAGDVSTFLNDSSVTELDVQLDPHKCAFGQWYYGQGRQRAQEQVPSLTPLLEAIEKPHADLHASAAVIKELFKQPHDELLNQLYGILTAHLSWVNKVSDQLTRAVGGHALGAALDPNFTLGVETDPGKCVLGRFLLSPETEKIKAGFPALQEALAQLSQPHQQMHASALRMENLIRRGQAEQAVKIYEEQTLPALAEVGAGLEKAIQAESNLQKASLEAQAVYAKQTKPNLEKVSGLLNQIRADAKRHIMTDDVMLESARETQYSVMAVSLVALVLGILTALVITSQLVKPIHAAKRAVDSAADGDFTFELSDSLLKRGDELGLMLRSVNKMRDKLSNAFREVIFQAESVANSANEISQGNQDLSDRTQSQASAIEETASSLEELTSSVRNTAQHSVEANHLAQKTNQMARNGGEVLQETIDAMSEVTDSSRKIAEITDMVNEIAFQTNLLALNAAVEAARAGEAGRGFAVVSGEVRNLAGRASSAAKEIQQLITSSVSKVEHSNALASKSGELLGQIIGNMQTVADTINEISASSQEQAQGIDEINRAIAQMDEAVQQNAALVEESAAASENQATAADNLRAEMDQFKVSMSGVGMKALMPPD